MNGTPENIIAERLRLKAEGDRRRAEDRRREEARLNRQRSNGSPSQSQAAPAQLEPPAPRQDVEFLLDSKISVDYFKMKNSHYFSMVDKEEQRKQSAELSLNNQSNQYAYYQQGNEEE